MPSRRKRATRFSSFVISGWRSLSATLRPVASWMPRYTAPKPPSPIFDSIRNRLLSTWLMYISSPLGFALGTAARGGDAFIAVLVLTCCPALGEPPEGVVAETGDCARGCELGTPERACGCEFGTPVAAGDRAGWLTCSR